VFQEIFFLIFLGAEVLAVESEARAKEVVAWRKQQDLQV
jgi:hypothetical protein